MLVFQIQPIAGKFLLPVFGGGAAVWTACMFFFQSMLLAGYGYAHVLTTSLEPRTQAAAHAALVVLSAMLLPITFAVDGPVPGTGSPAVLIWVALFGAIGFPFVMLASTAPLLQRWSSMTRPSRSPYRLYALSNAGALLALLTYPVLIEPNIRLAMQTLVWSAGYLAFVLLSLAACRLLWLRKSAKHPVSPETQTDDRAAGARAWKRTDAALALVLSALGVVVLLAVTNQITQNVAPIPFLWILPLLVYLLTFIVCFSGERWYDRSIWGSLFVVSASSLIVLEFFAAKFAIVPVVSAYLLLLLCICMLCHGELYRLRPAPRQLGAYYLVIATGGAIGGALVSLAAPLVFVRYWDALAGVWLIYLAFGVIVIREQQGARETESELRASAKELRIERWARRLFAAGWTIGLFLFPAVVFALNALLPRYDVASSRNFYGVLNVRDITGGDLPRRILVDGTTIHGFQLLDESRRTEPTSYYGTNTGIGMVMQGIERTANGVRVGVVGLGVGTLAAYGQPSDEYRFYELNPAVIELANEYFSFLADSAAGVDIVAGDGRISLERELRQGGSRNYDVLIIDAFSSDAIPVHLLTREAHQLYWSHLKPGGVLAFHVTNNYLDLASVVANAGTALGKQPLLLTTPSDSGTSSTADWVVLTDDPYFLAGRTADSVIMKRPPPLLWSRIWTDDYSDLLGTIRAGQ